MRRLECRFKARLGSEVWEMLGKAGLERLFQDLGDDQEHSPIGNQTMTRKPEGDDWSRREYLPTPATT
jgi:hypothetical protein